MVAPCDRSTAGGARDAALVAILYGCGLRRQELAGLALDDYDQTTGALKVRAGKGNQDRMVYCTNGAKTLLDSWLAHRGSEPGRMFVPVLKSGRVTVRAISAQAIY